MAKVVGVHRLALKPGVNGAEFEEFMRVISPWEREHLLLSV